MNPAVHGEAQRSPDGAIAQVNSKGGLETSLIMMTHTVRPASNNSFRGRLFKDQGTTIELKPEGVFCEICNKPASGHLYYGARSCHSCRAFFRRAVQGGKYSSFKCWLSQNCQIDSKSWKSCQWCRFQQCLKAGMREIPVQNEKKQRVIKVLNHCQQIATNVSMDNHLSNALTLEEKELMIKSTIEIDTDWWLDLIRLYKQNPSCADHFFHLSHLTEAFAEVDNDPTLRLIRLVLKHTTLKRFVALGVNHNVLLDPNDAEALIEKASRLECLLLLLITMELPMPDYGSQDFAKEKFQATGGGDDFALFLQFSNNWKISEEKASSYRDQFTSPWAVDHDVELHHCQLYRTLINSFYSLSEDKLLLMLLHDLFTFTKGDLLLKNPSAVEKMFRVKSSLLFRYLREKCGEAAAERHAQLLRVHSILVELNDIAKTKTLLL